MKADWFHIDDARTEEACKNRDKTWQPYYPAKRVELLIEALKDMAKYKDDGNAEGFFGTEAEVALKEFQNWKETP